MGYASSIVPRFSINCGAEFIYFNSCSSNVMYRTLSRNFHPPNSPHFLSKPRQITLYRTSEWRRICAARTVQFYIFWGHVYDV